MQVTETTARIREIKPINFLFFRTETTVEELGKFIPVAKELFREAVNYSLHVTGPVHWHYIGFTGDVTKPFTLEIAIPVSEVVSGYDGAFHFKRTDSFRCVSITHEGGWMEIPQSYGVIMQFIAEHKLQPVGINRELYINADFSDLSANITEIQVGISQ